MFSFSLRWYFIYSSVWDGALVNVPVVLLGVLFSEFSDQVPWVDLNSTVARWVTEVFLLIRFLIKVSKGFLLPRCCPNSFSPEIPASNYWPHPRWVDREGR